MGPGFNPTIARAVERIDRALRLVYDPKRGFWIVVRKARPQQRAWWSGFWHIGWEIILRWRGVRGEFRAPRPGEEVTFLPLDNRLLAVLRYGDQRRRGQDAKMLSVLEDIERRRWQSRQERREARRAESDWFYGKRHDRGVVTSIGGMAPGVTNDGETEEEAIRRLKGRQRAAFLRSRGGRLPLHLQELERDMIRKEQARRKRVG